MHRTSSRTQPTASPPSFPGSLGHPLRLAAGVGTVLLAAVVGAAAPAVAGLTGYGPVGPDPATQLGLSAPVLAAEVGGPRGSVVTADLPGGTVTVTRPDGYSADSQILSITDLSGPGVAEALLPADMLVGTEVVLGFGVGVRSVETAGEDPAVQGRAVRSSRSAPAAAPRAAMAAPARSDVLTVLVESRGIAGATVVVVDDGIQTSVSPGQSMTFDLDGPAAVFALQPADDTDAGSAAGPAPAAEEEPAPVEGDADTEAAAADGAPDGGGLGTVAIVGIVALLVVAAAVALTLARGSRGGRRRLARQ